MEAPSQRLWFVCPDTDVPAGGVRVIYRAVDHLRAAGHEAFVVHEQPGFRCTWFANATPVARTEDIDPLPGVDLLVVPEIYGPDLGDIAPGVTKVVFNQNSWNTFAGYPSVEPGRTAYDHVEVAGAVCVSEDEAAILRWTFPGLDVRRLRLQIDSELFQPGPKRRMLAYMPRKGAADAARVIATLQARGALDGVEVVALHGVGEAEVAATLREALVFLSFSFHEGWGLPPLEAMASGCAVVGYDGIGGREFMTAEHAWPIEHGDILAFARTVEDLLDLHAADPAALAARTEAASSFVRATYTAAAERESVLAAFTGRS